MPEQTTTTHPHTSHRETFNQIVLMLIVAFTLRVFVVEAFVIPTGSMAPTLKGAHSRFACENCGYDFDVNYSPTRSSSTDINIPRTTVNQGAIYCPNCGYRVPPDDADKLLVYYGDRILVMKYSYLLRDPQRWDVVVFKTPSEPAKYHYSQAYIKRLIGKPGEQIMILDGDIYVARATSPTDADWRIQQKPDVVQNALWRIVHDIDYAPQGLPPTRDMRTLATGVEAYQPWRSDGKDWIYTRDETGARAFHFRDMEGSSSLAFDHGVGSTKLSLTDFLAYDQLPGQLRKYPVGDLKLSFYYRRAPGSTGSLEVQLSKRQDLFIAQLDGESASLFRAPTDAPASRRLIARTTYKLTDRPAKLDFTNVDYRVRLLVDGKEVLATTPQDYSPDVAALRQEHEMPSYPTVRISATKQVCAITHLSLWRDVFYTSLNQSGSPVLRGGPDNPVKLGSDEYLTLGDNSPLSADGRYWEEPVDLPLENIHVQAGVVPGRFLLGKALLVYWPAGFRLYGTTGPDLIPNFGEMRFIH